MYLTPFLPEAIDSGFDIATGYRGGSVLRTFTDASLGCCGYSSQPNEILFVAKRGLFDSGLGDAVANKPQYGVIQLAADVIYGDGFSD